MKSPHEMDEAGVAFDRPPFLYEIRVKGRLSDEQWTSWFSDLSVATAGGETTLLGRVPDQAGLYGILARLRDLAVPLVAVRVLDAEAQSRLARQSRRYDRIIDGLLIVIYLALVGGLSAITIFLAPLLSVTIALTLAFALMGGLAHLLGLWSRQPLWRWAAYTVWAGAALTFLVFIPTSGMLPPAIGISLMLLLGAGGLLYVVSALRRRAEDVRGRLAGSEAATHAADDSD